MAATQKTLPKEAQVIISIMKDMGITDYEPRVITQLLEFTYRYVTGILDDSRVFANHAKKKMIDMEDVKLAIQMTTDRIFTVPPPRDILLDVARTKNSTPLPFVKPHCGLRLPPDRYCLSACNFRMKTLKKPQPKQVMNAHNLGAGPGFMNAAMAGTGAVKMQAKQQQQQNQAQAGQQNQQNISIMKRPGTLTTVARTQSITIPKPVIKFSSGAGSMGTTAGTGTTGVATVALPKAMAKPKIQIAQAGTANSTGLMVPPVKMDTDDMMATLKRKREEAEDYDMLE